MDVVKNDMQRRGVADDSRDRVRWRKMKKY